MRRAVVVVVACTSLLASCVRPGLVLVGRTPPGNSRAFVARSDEYLRWATASFVPSDPLSVVASAERSLRDKHYHFDATAVTPDVFQPIFDRLTNLVDTSDFDLLYLLNMFYGYRTMLPPATQDAIKEHLLEIKYWYTEPTQPGLVDNRYYWSENHRIIYYTNEYLAGSAFPNDTFTNDGRTGVQHAQTADQAIRQWIDEKVRFGFTEWHSDVYYQKDIDALLTLAEFAPSPDLANRASMVLDLFLLDIALHLQRGTFGATHGRSYMKDKSTATDEDTFNLSKLLFDDTSEQYTPGADPGATLFASAHRYRMPDVIRRIAKSDDALVDQEHMNVPLDALAPVTPNPVAPYGYDFNDPNNIPFWWERGAQTAWQVVPNTIQTLDKYNLWDSSFYAPFKPLRDLVGNDMVAAQRLAQALAPGLTFGLLTDVNTYTYRTPDVMLSTAQDYRPGVFSEQTQISQATLDEHALVFTTHPKNEPQIGTQWPDSDGYWTGNGSLPRAAQHGAVSFSIYDPQFQPYPPPLDQFSYLDYTHAYFPTEKFDQVVQDGNWTFGRKGNGYIALWSQHTPHWRTFDPTKYFTHGLTEPFDLVAPSAKNVWIAQVGDANTFGTFDAFRAKVGSSLVVAGDGTVAYNSPTEGVMTFGFHQPLVVQGQSVDLHPTPRIDNRYVQVPFQGRHYVVRDGGDSLILDFDHWTRVAS